MDEQTPTKLKFWIFWYRLLGHPPVQAEWKARARCEGVKVEKPKKRLTCACGFNLKQGQRECPRCGRKQWIPDWVHRVLLAMGIHKPTAAVGTLLALFSMVVGYGVQLFVGQGNLLDPTKDWTEFYELGASIGVLNLAQPWRTVTYTLLHGGLAHLVFNAIALIQVGPLIEMRFGTGRFALCWVFAGAVGIVAPSWIFGSNLLAPTVGASGAIFGLIGMALLRGHLDGDARGILIRNVMIRWTAYTTLFGILMGGVAHGAHFGGLFAGMLVCFLCPPEDGHSIRHKLSPVFGVIAMIAYVTAIVFMIKWNLEGNPVPESIDNGDALAVYQVRVQDRGADTVFDKKAQELFHRAWELKRSAEQMHVMPDVDDVIPKVTDTLEALQKDVLTYIKNIPMNMRIPFLRELLQRSGEAQLEAWDRPLVDMIAQGVIPSPQSLNAEEHAQ